MRLPSQIAECIACLTFIVGLNSCASDRGITRGPAHPPRAPLLTATKADLLQRVSTLCDSIKSLKIVADMTLSRGSVYKGEITDYRNWTGYIDFRKPADIRVVASLPLLHTTEFVMVSNRGKFSAYLSRQNRFITGEDDAPGASPNQTENMRPGAFLSALLVKPLDPSGDVAVLLDDTVEQYSHYILQSMRKLPGNDFGIVRTVTFDRVDLKIIEQREYAPNGVIISLTQYGGWKEYSGIGFPSQIRIMRYLEEYGATLDITRLELNNSEPDSSFVLDRPAGSTLQVIGSETGAGK